MQISSLKCFWKWEFYPCASTIRCKSCNNIIIQCPKMFKLFNQQQNKWEVGCFATHMISSTNVWINIQHHLQCAPKPKTIWDNNIKKLLCNCMNFVTMIASSLGGWGKWGHCKHMYILQHAMYCKQMEKNLHHPNWGWSKVKRLTIHARWVDFCPI